MQRTLLLAAIAIALIAAGVSYTFAKEEKPAEVSDTPAWEYRVILLAKLVDFKFGQDAEILKTAVEAKFNELGQEGWEYCGDLPGTALFKRPKP